MIALYALRNLRRRPVRSVMTVIGIALAMALSTMMFSIGAGIRHSTEELLEGGGIDAYVIAEGGDLLLGTGYFEHGRDLAAHIGTDHPEVLHAIPVLYETVYISREATPSDPSNVSDVSAMGVDPVLLGDFKGADITSPVHAHRIDGSLLPTKEDLFHNDWNIMGDTDIDVAHNENFTGELSLNRALADDLGAIIGDQVFISTTSDMTNPARFEVVSISSPLAEYPWLKGATLHLSELQYIKNLRNDTVNRIFLDLSVDADVDHLRKEVEEDHSVTFISLDDLYESIDSITVAFEGYANMIVVITFLVAAMFISTILIISVRERMVELGALRAMGISKRTIISNIIIESFILTFIGLVLGLVMGYIMAGFLDGFIKDMGVGLPSSAQIALVTPMVVVQVVGLASLVGLTAGLLPAYWVTRLNIRAVLKGE